MARTLLPEPMLTESRTNLFPPKYPALFQCYKYMKSVLWSPDEVDLTKDREDWLTLTEDDRNCVSKVLGFFAGADNLVNENLINRFFSEVELLEARQFYCVQIYMEAIHVEMYNLLIEAIIDNDKKPEVFEAMEHSYSTKLKAEWMQKWMRSDAKFGDRVVAFVAVEGLFFSASFAIIFWLKQKRVMKGLCFSNEYIARDEGLHCSFGTLVYTTLIVNKMTSKEMEELMRGAVDVELQFVAEILPVKLSDCMTRENMETYVKFVANQLMLALGESEIYPDIVQPFDFMENIGMEGKTNFFERHVSDYQKVNVMDEEGRGFSLSAEF